MPRPRPPWLEGLLSRLPDSGESRRNENVAITLLDNNALKEDIKRLGTTATIVTEFKADARLFPYLETPADELLQSRQDRSRNSPNYGHHQRPPPKRAVLRRSQGRPAEPDRTSAIQTTHLRYSLALPSVSFKPLKLGGISVPIPSDAAAFIT